MATPDLERMFDDWAMAWTSNDPEKVLALFTDDCVFEDAVARGKEEIRSFATRAFAAVPDFKYGVRRRFATKPWLLSSGLCQAHTKATSQGYRPLASAFRRCVGRPSSNSRPVNPPRV